jgi:acyl dehydratase
MTRYAPRWFEEFEVGDTFETAGFTFFEGSVADFALTWDPQPFHLDKTYADASIYGGVIASGFQTLLVCFRLVHQSGVFGHNRGGRGVDELRWPKAVYPGDTVRAKATIASMEPARTTGHTGVACEVFNQNDEVVLTTRFNYVIAKRPDAG